MANRWHKGKFKPKHPEKYIGENINGITYRSSWELKFCQLCDEHPNIVYWASEAISIKYKHPFTKQIKSYIPDFFIIYVDGKGKKHSEVIEIKPNGEANPKYAKSTKQKEMLVINMAKWEAARIYCKKHKVAFRILTEKEIFSNTKYSSNTKNPYRRRKK